MKFGQWLSFIVIIISLYVIWQIRQLLLIFFTAIVIATVLNRLVLKLQTYRIKRIVAVSIVILGVLCLLTFFFWLIVPPFVQEFYNLIELIPQVWEKVRQQIIIIEKQEWVPPIPEGKELFSQLQPFGTAIVRNFITLFSNSFGVLLQTVFLIVLTTMILANPQGYRAVLLKVFPSFYRRRANQIIDKTEIALVNWVSGTLISCLFVGIFSGIGLLFLQVKLVLVHAVLAGILNLIPNIGPTMSVVFPVMVAVLEEPWKIVAILILYFMIQNFESYILTPVVMAQQVALLPAITLLAQIFFASTFGVLGLLLALPLTVVAKVWIEAVLFEDILDQWQEHRT